MNTIETDKAYIMNTYSRFPLSLVKGEGCIVYDDAGKRYIDLTAGIGVNAFGYCDKVWQEAVTEQLSTLQHTSNLYYTAPCTNLAQLLCKKTGMSKVFFSNSGAEANECAIKAARRFSLKKNGGGFHQIITFKNSFHGRTVTTLSATGQEQYHTDFGPFTEGFLYADTTPESLRELAHNNGCAAIMLETIQGEGGVCELSQELISAVKELSKQYDIPLIVDEIQTGNGRTGKFFSYMHFGLEPDIVTTAKGLAGGLPIGATLFSERFSEALVPGTHGSTFGGNPVVCAAAISVVERIDDALLNEVAAKGDYLKAELLKFDTVKGVSGKGLMLGVEVEGEVKEKIAKCMENGVLVLSAKTKLRLLPPLNISWDELKEATIILESSL